MTWAGIALFVAANFIRLVALLIAGVMAYTERPWFVWVGFLCAAYMLGASSVSVGPKEKSE